MENIYTRPQCMTGTPFNFFPIREHATVFRLVGEIVDELKIREKLVGVVGLGPAVFMPEYFHFDFVSAAQGMAPSVAFGVKTVHPESIVFTYQGFRDMSEGSLGQLVARASRNHPITAIFINTGVFQSPEGEFYIAPENEHTDLPPVNEEAPRYAEIISASTRKGCFVARGSLYDDKGIQEVKAHLKTGFSLQLERKGFSFIEILPPVPALSRLPAQESRERVQTLIEPHYPLRVFQG